MRVYKWKILGSLLLVVSGFMFSGALRAFSPESYPLLEVQQTAVSGQVLDASGQPMLGVNVIFKGTKIGTVTDADGRFDFPNAQFSSVNTLTLVFSYLGYADLEMPATRDMKVVMKEDVQTLEDTVVIGYKVIKKSDLTTSIETIGDKAFQNRPVMNAVQALQGAVGNLQISTGNNGGELGTAPAISIRGGYSVNGNPAPLVLIDGVEGSLNLINPADIEKVEVFKDGAAAAIYGSRASTGVIYITTKSGVKGKAKITLTANTAFNSPTYLPQIPNALEWVTAFNDAGANSGTPNWIGERIVERIRLNIENPNPTNADLNNPGGDGVNRYGVNRTGVSNVNYYDVIYRKSQPQMKYDVAMSGGNEKVNYYFSGGVLDVAGAFRYGNDNYQRYNFNTKIGADITSYFKLTANIKYNIDTKDAPYSVSSRFGSFYHAIPREWPTTPLYDSYGNLSNEFVLTLAQGGRSRWRQNNINANIDADLRIYKDLTITGRLGINNFYSESSDHLKTVYRPLVDQTLIAVGGTTPSSFTRYFTNNEYYTISVFANYDKIFAKDHSFSATGGMQAEDFRRKWNSGTQTVVPAETPSLSGGSGPNPLVSDADDQLANLGYFGRASYDFKKQYFISASVRADGSSRFPSGQRWGVFPSVSAALVVSRYGFWQNSEALKFWDTFKVRASYGSIGNQQYGTSLFSSLYLQYPVLANTQSTWILNNVRQRQFGAPALTSSRFSWETYRTLGVGFDIGMFRNRLNINIDLYQRNTVNMLAPAAVVPATLGSTAPRVNVAELVNRGYELAITWSDRIGKDFSYSVKGILADNLAKVVSYPNERKLLSTFYNGFTVGDIYGYETDKVLQTQEDIDNMADQTQLYSGQYTLGDIAYKDLNGDGKITQGENTADDPGDRRVIGNSTPRYNYSLLAEVSWKGFDFRMFWQGIGKRDLWLSGNFFWGIFNQWQSTPFKHTLDYWRPDNTDAYYPKPYLNNNEDHGNRQTQTRYLQNGAYIRLKNIQLGYTLPEKITRAVKINMARFYASAENILAISPLFARGFDPEATDGSWGSGKVYPLAKTISFGVNVEF